MAKQVFTAEVGGRPLSIEIGHVAKQANGSAWVRYGDTIVLATATMGAAKDEGFLPLTIVYEEKAYAAGKIPGGFFKREGRPHEHEVHFARLIDRPIRPLFPEGFNNETQVFAYVISYDQNCTAEFPALLAASIALFSSDIPFTTPVVGVRVGRVGGQFVLNPTPAQHEESDLDMMVVVSDDGITMVEGGAHFVPESVIVDGLVFAQEAAAPILKLQHEIRKAIGKPKAAFNPPADHSTELGWLKSNFGAKLTAAAKVIQKHERSAAFSALKSEAKAGFIAQFPDKELLFGSQWDLAKEKAVRQLIRSGVRNDGRDWKTVRPITIDMAPLPRAHGSSIFTRGETQSIVTCTLGTTDDEVKQDGIAGTKFKKFYLHYNFPPFSVGEVRRVGSPGRREVGHGLLAERAISHTIPEWTDFPYTVRIVSDITESNGSSSMASVCGGTLALMDAGVPIREPIAGVAMGLIEEEGDMVVPTDILGDEDHLGDMDFKVAGGASGITALQMDIKVRRVSKDLLSRALEQARVARLHILGEMHKAMPTTRTEMSQYAPRFEKILIHPDKIREVIGPGGKMIRSIVEESGAKIDILDDGVVFIYATSLESAMVARRRIEAICAVPEPGKYYEGLVKKTVDFGAFIEIMPGTEGLCHVSELDNQRVQYVQDVVREGDAVIVKVLSIEANGKIRLSRKAAMHVTPETLDAENDKAAKGD